MSHRSRLRSTSLRTIWKFCPNPVDLHWTVTPSLKQSITIQFLRKIKTPVPSMFSTLSHPLIKLLVIRRYLHRLSSTVIPSESSVCVHSSSEHNLGFFRFSRWPPPMQGKVHQTAFHGGNVHSDVEYLLQFVPY